MARDFSKNTSNYMRLGANALGALLDGAPGIACHCWANFDTISTTSGDNALMTIWGTNASMNFRMAVHDGTNPVFRISSRPVAAEAQRNAIGTTNLTIGTWYSLGASVDFVNDTITPYVNGAGEGATAAAFTATAYSTGTPTTSFDSIGSNGTPTAGTQVDGRIAEMAVWGSTLTAAEFASLGNGVSALLIRPQSILLYMVLLGNMSPEPDRISGVSGTITGTVAKADHCRIIRPSQTRISLPANAATSSMSRGSSLTWKILSGML